MPIQKQNVTLFLPALGILALYLFTRLFSMESGLEETAAALLEQPHKISTIAGTGKPDNSLANRFFTRI